MFKAHCFTTQIVHKRLATRNILLTSRLVPKVAGFGPTPEEGENEVDQKRGKVCQIYIYIYNVFP